ncbi:MAG: hypothetical protein ACR2RL_25450, partial [Gammaproteobacteria bacterium]
IVLAEHERARFALIDDGRGRSVARGRGVAMVDCLTSTIVGQSEYAWTHCSAPLGARHGAALPNVVSDALGVRQPCSTWVVSESAQGIYRGGTQAG